MSDSIIAGGPWPTFVTTTCLVALRLVLCAAKCFFRFFAIDPLTISYMLRCFPGEPNEQFTKGSWERVVCHPSRPTWANSPAESKVRSWILSLFEPEIAGYMWQRLRGMRLSDPSSQGLLCLFVRTFTGSVRSQ